MRSRARTRDRLEDVVVALVFVLISSGGLLIVVGIGRLGDVVVLVG